MFQFSVFVFGRLSCYLVPVGEQRMQELVEWAIDNDFSYCVEAVPE